MYYLAVVNDDHHHNHNHRIHSEKRRRKRIKEKGKEGRYQKKDREGKDLLWVITKERD